MPSTPTSSERPEIADRRDDQPTLYRDRSFWAMTATQFLGAFNDNLFKQLVLLLSAGGVGAVIVGQKPPDRQGEAMVIFALPFLLFSGVAGYLSERLSKTHIVVAAKVAEILVMCLGVVAFVFYRSFGLTGAFIVLGLMGMQSAFFGPSKYGILPEMLRERDLPRANGFFLMTTFVAIILGTAVAGFLKGTNINYLWIPTTVCIAIAVVGTCTALLVRYIPAARADLEFEKSTLAIPPDIRALLARDRTLLGAVVLSCLFWLLGGLVLLGVNALGLRQLLIGAKLAGILAACMSVGIAAGCLLAGKLCHGRADFRLVRFGAWMMVVCLFLLGMPAIGAIGNAAGTHLLGFYGSIPVLIALGMAAGMFAVPLQVVIQTHPPQGQKGRMIAALNICTWLSILISGVLYGGAAKAIAATELPEASVFFFAILFILPVALLCRTNQS